MTSQRELSSYRSEPYAWARGSNHQLRAALRKMERGGEIFVYWSEASIDRRGVLSVPFVRLKARSAVQREVRIRWTVFAVSCALATAGALYALWTIRAFVLTTLGLAVTVALFVYFEPHLVRGCSGIHCTGCKG